MIWVTHTIKQEKYNRKVLNKKEIQMYNDALKYEYLINLSSSDLLEVEQLCIATQDTWTLSRIQKIKQWRNPSNRSKIVTPTSTVEDEVVEDLCSVPIVEDPCLFTGFYNI